jgi:glycerol-3-phosphate dehydrogenase (NAD(P)+)
LGKEACVAIVAVVGAGMMGTALCTPIADAGNDVRLVGTHLDGQLISAMKSTRIHPKLGLPLPEGVTPYAVEELALAMEDVDIIAVGVSSGGVRWAAENLAPYLKPGLPIIAVTKGLEEIAPGVLCVLPDVFVDALPVETRSLVSPAAIGGPCIAGELARRVDTSVVFTGRDRDLLGFLAAAFSTPYYNVRVSTNIVGVEVCAALKNAYAMAVGIGAGLNERSGSAGGPVAHHNWEAAVFAEACLEMDRLVRALGGDPSVVPHLPGAGDLLVTTSGGRSSRLGRLLGLGLAYQQAREQMVGDTLESADTVAVVGGAIPRLVERGVIAPGALPLMEHLHEIIVLGRPADMPFNLFFRE